MTAALPAALTYGTVRWWVVGVAEDSADPGKEPDTELIQGTVTFRPVVDAVKYIGTAEDLQPVTVLPRTYTYEIKNGILVNSDGSPDIKLVACDSPGTSPQGWQYLVEYQLADGYTFGSFRFSLHTDELVDLTLKVPEQAVTGTLYVTGPPGPAATVAVGSVATGAPGTDATVVNTGNASNAVLEFTIPQGDQGVQGPQGRGFTPRGSYEDMAAGTQLNVDDIVTLAGETYRIMIDLTKGSPEDNWDNWEKWAARGPQGDQGIPGTAATIAVGNVATVAPGNPATITNVGTSGAAVFDFEIPKGDPGTGSVNSVNGDPGPDVVLDAADVGAAPAVHTHTANQISNSTAVGQSVLTAADAATARAAIGAGTYSAAAATTAAQGLVELATTAEATTGVDATRAVTPAGLKAVADTKVNSFDAGLTTIRKMTQAAYDALGSKDAATLYVIVG